VGEFWRILGAAFDFFVIDDVVAATHAGLPGDVTILISDS
jgi:hypothetical protein